MVPNFDTRQLMNFNHLIYIDDLIIVTKASQTVVKNYHLCLNNYKNLTRQNSNTDKFTVHLPSLCNKKISKETSSILRMKLGNYPFNHLGVSISPKWLSIN